MKAGETVLYYTPEKTERTTKLKGIFVRLGLRIKNIEKKDFSETVGYLAGMPGFSPSAGETAGEGEGEGREIPEEMLVMKGFSGRKIDELLMTIKKAGLSKIELKAIVTEHNADWTFYHLYEEIKEEHDKMNEARQADK